MTLVATIIVNETAGMRRFAYPLQTTVALPRGCTHHLEMLHLQEVNGTPVPAQIDPEDTWQDGSVQLLSIHFPCSMGPLEQKLYRLVTSEFPIQRPPVTGPIDWSADEHRFGATVRKFIPMLDRRGTGLFLSVLDDGKEFMGEESMGLGIVTARGDRLLASDYASPGELRQAGPLTGHILWRGVYPQRVGLPGMGYSTQMRFTLFKSWIELTHTLQAPAGAIEEVFAHTRLRVSALPLLYDIGAGGGTYGKIEAGESITYRAEIEPFQTRWTLSTLKGDTTRADVVGVRSSHEPMQHEWLHWIDRDKSLALVTESSWHSRGMAYDVGSAGDLSVRFFPALEDYAMTLQFKVWYHFLAAVPHIGAATSPQSIMWPPTVACVIPE
jgi:hypothetical protein